MKDCYFVVHFKEFKACMNAFSQQFLYTQQESREFSSLMIKTLNNIIKSTTSEVIIYNNNNNNIYSPYMYINISIHFCLVTFIIIVVIVIIIEEIEENPCAKCKKTCTYIRNKMKMLANILRLVIVSVLLLLLLYFVINCTYILIVIENTCESYLLPFPPLLFFFFINLYLESTCMSRACRLRIK